MVCPCVSVLQILHIVHCMEFGQLANIHEHVHRNTSFESPLQTLQQRSRYRPTTHCTKLTQVPLLSRMLKTDNVFLIHTHEYTVPEELFRKPSANTKHIVLHAEMHSHTLCKYTHNDHHHNELTTSASFWNSLSVFVYPFEIR